MLLATVSQALAKHNLLTGAFSNEYSDIKLSAIVTDSRACTPGAIFVAIKGLVYDGHDFIDQAIQNGAAAVICEHPISLHIPTLTVVNSRKAAAILSAMWWGKPADDLICIGVTGTNGKTTTSFMIDAILEEAGYTTGIIGTLLTKIGGRLIESTMTTPEPWRLHHLLHHMVEQDVQTVTMEVSSHAIVQDRCYGLKFDVGILTNITHDHFDLHPTLEHYIQTKGRFFELLAHHGLALANGDDPLVRQALSKTGTSNLVLFGLSPGCRIRGENTVSENAGISFTLVWDDLVGVGGWPIEAGSLPIRLKIPGIHNVYNAVGAAATALYLGIQPRVISQALAAFVGVSRRLQYIYQGEIAVIDDFAHNPASLKAAVEATAALRPRRLIIVHAIRGNRGVTINKENAETLVRCIQQSAQACRFILTASEDVVGAHDRVSTAEKQVFFDSIQRAEVPFSFYPTLYDALQSAVGAAEPGDLILLLGAQGMDAASRLFRQIITDYPEITKADPYDELSSEPAIITIPEYLQTTNR